MNHLLRQLSEDFVLFFEKIVIPLPNVPTVLIKKWNEFKALLEKPENLLSIHTYVINLYHDGTPMDCLPRKVSLDTSMKRFQLGVETANTLQNSSKKMEFGLTSIGNEPKTPKLKIKSDQVYVKLYEVSNWEKQVENLEEAKPTNTIIEGHAEKKEQVECKFNFKNENIPAQNVPEEQLEMLKAESPKKVTFTPTDNSSFLTPIQTKFNPFKLKVKGIEVDGVTPGLRTNEKGNYDSPLLNKISIQDLNGKAGMLNFHNKNESFAKKQQELTSMVEDFLHFFKKNRETLEILHDKSSEVVTPMLKANDNFSDASAKALNPELKKYSFFLKNPGNLEKLDQRLLGNNNKKVINQMN